MKLNSSTRLIGLIGNPIGHSISPSIHNSLYKALDMDYIYAAFNVEHNLVQEAVEGMGALSFAGFNVTIPYKEKVIEFLDELDEEARLIGAVNTVKIKDGRLKGYNTDGMGFIEGLKRLDFYPSGKEVVIIGAGGASRAISVYLLNGGISKLYILNRTYQNAIELADELNQNLDSNRVVAIERAELDELNPDLIVNTTPVGMHPHINNNPLEGFIFNARTVVVDIIYNPYETVFLKEAKKQGCTVQNGMDMLIGQALAAIKIWTGQDIPFEYCQNVLGDNDLSICL